MDRYWSVLNECAKLSFVHFHSNLSCISLLVKQHDIIFRPTPGAVDLPVLSYLPPNENAQGERHWDFSGMRFAACKHSRPQHHSLLTIMSNLCFYPTVRSFPLNPALGCVSLITSDHSGHIGSDAASLTQLDTVPGYINSGLWHLCLHILSCIQNFILSHFDFYLDDNEQDRTFTKKDLSRTQSKTAYFR